MSPWLESKTGELFKKVVRAKIDVANLDIKFLEFLANKVGTE